jgi:hypothetical protein
MKPISSQAEWYEFESARWREAVRDHDLRLASLDPDQRRRVLDAINADLEQHKASVFKDILVTR